MQDRERLTDVESKLVVAKEEGEGEINWESGISICTYTHWDLLQSTENYFQCLVITYNEKESGKE